MSETITLTTATAVIYGSIAGARAYLGAVAETWDVATDADVGVDMKRMLVRARRMLDGFSYDDDFDTFEKRDALDLGTGDGDGAFPFRAASYLLANAGYENPSIFDDASASDIASMSAGGANISYRNETKAASKIDTLPPDVLALIASYFDDDTITASISAEGGASSTGSCVNPFGPCRDFDRNEPW